MPTFYTVRKSTRGQWTQEDLTRAVEAVLQDKVAIRQAARTNNIPEKTLRTRLVKGNFIKGSSMGGASFLGEDTERKLCNHIQKLQASGFAPTSKNLRVIAYNLAQSMGLRNRFNEDKKMAGVDWLKLFLKRNPVLSIRKAEGVSMSRAEGMNKEEVQKYFELLTKILTENDLLVRPLNIFNMDETGLQLNNVPGKVVAMKGSKDVHVVTAQERGETITVVACCNAEGNFMPPYCIFKGVNMQQVWQENMPPGSVIKMRRESAYISEDLFMDWFQTHFLPRKPVGKCLLILDGHGSHMNSYEMLETAVQNDVILLCLPSHTTHFLQPLDRAFFKPLKTYFKNACDEFIRANPQKKIERRHFGALLSAAWTHAATSQTGASGFSATGIFPLKPSAVPEHAFLACSNLKQNSESVVEQQENIPDNGQESGELPSTPSLTPFELGPSTSSASSVSVDDGSPSKILNMISPVPVFTTNKQTKRRKQSAQNLTSSSFIADKKEKRLSREKVKNRKKNKMSEKTIRKTSQKTHQNIPKDLMTNELTEINSAKRRRKASQKTHQNISKELMTNKLARMNSAKRRLVSSSSEEDGTFSINDSTDDETFDENECVGCLENYESTTSTAEWIQCVECHRWLHDTCTPFKMYCMSCGKKTIAEK